MLRTIVLPLLLYRLEHCCPTSSQCQMLQKLFNDFVLPVTGVSTKVCQKTLHSPTGHGLGVPYLPILIPTRILDMVQKSANTLRFHTTPPQHPMSPYSQLAAAKKLLPIATRTLHDCSYPNENWHTAADLRISWSTHDCPIPSQAAFTDGSLLTSNYAAGAAAILPHGIAISARCPGRQTIYKSELLGICLAAMHSPPGTTIWCDSKGAVTAIKNSRQPVKEKLLVQQARKSLIDFSHGLQWLKGYAGHLDNEYVDRLAKLATQLPPQPPQRPKTPWDIAYQGELFQPPHKVWTHDYIPHHSSKDIHRISFAPLRSLNLNWIKWIFGHIWRPGFSHFCTFWAVPPKAARNPCVYCPTLHNASVHGCVAYCVEEHPLVKAWCRAWGINAPAIQWRRQASSIERRLLRKLCIPTPLYDHLVASVGRKEARQSIFTFQKRVIALMEEQLNTQPRPPHQSACKRPSPWIEMDYDHGQASLPLKNVWKRPKGGIA